MTEQREIKFRAWHKADESWLPKSELSQYLTVLDGGEFFVPTNIILCQFTGLKDKNGVEIFEGDIVKAFDKYGERHFTAEHTDTVKNHQWGCWESCEVIGNIYEHSHLLEKGNA